MSIDKILGKALGEPLQRLYRSLGSISDRVEYIIKKLENQEEIMGLLADKIKSLVAVETEEGKALQAEIAKLKAALADSDGKLKDLAASSGVEKSELMAKVAELQSDIDAAMAAAEGIAAINPTPVSDGLVEEAKANDEVVVPPVVVDAPPVANEVIQEVPVVEAAVDAIVAAE